MPEMMMIFVLILLLFGPKKLPELARGVGKAMGEFKKAREEFEREISYAVKQAENESNKEPATRELTPAPAPATIAAAPAATTPAAPAPHEPPVA